MTTNCYYLSFLIDEIWLNLQDNIFYFPYHWETFHNRPSGRADWTFILGWHQKGLNANVGRAEGFDGQASPCVFRWARLFLGPGKWACEPFFPNSIKCKNEKWKLEENKELRKINRVANKTYPMFVFLVNVE